MDYATSVFFKVPSGNTSTAVRLTVPPHKHRLSLHFYSDSSFGNRKLLQMSLLRSLSLVPPDLQDFYRFPSPSGHSEVYAEAGSQIEESSLMLNPGGKEM